MFTTLALATIALSAVSAVDIPANFNPFETNAALQNDVARLTALTNGKPVTTFCVDKADATKPLAGAAKTACINDLGKELVTLQAKLTDSFFSAVVDKLNAIGTPFNRNRINNFDNAVECAAEIKRVQDALIKVNLAADAAAVKACDAQCGNVKLASECLNDKSRDALRTQQKTVGGNVVATADLVDSSQLPVFDRALNAQQQNAFVALADANARLLQSIDGLVAGQLAAAVAEGKKGNYRDYKALVVKAEDEVKQVVDAFLVELEKDKRIADAKLRLNALEKQPEGLLVKSALDLAVKRSAVVAAPVVIHARVANIAVADEKAITDNFKAILGPEAVFGAAVADAKNAGKKQFDVAMGVDQGEIATQEHEFGLACVKANLQCSFVQDVHKPLFDLVQVAPKVVAKAPAGNNGYGAPPHAPVGEADSASSLLVAAGAVLAAVAAFL